MGTDSETPPAVPYDTTNSADADDSFMKQVFRPQKPATSPAMGPATQSISSVPHQSLDDESWKGQELNGDLFASTQLNTQLATPAFLTSATLTKTRVEVTEVARGVEIEVEKLTVTIVGVQEVKPVAEATLTNLSASAIASPSEPIEKSDPISNNSGPKEDSFNLPSSSALVEDALLRSRKSKKPFPDHSEQSGKISEELGPDADEEPDSEDSVITSDRVVPLADDSIMDDGTLSKFGPISSTPANGLAPLPLPLATATKLIPLPPPTKSATSIQARPNVSGFYQSAEEVEEIRKNTVIKPKSKPKKDEWSDDQESPEKVPSPVADVENPEEEDELEEEEEEITRSNGEKDMSISQTFSSSTAPEPAHDPNVTMEETMVEEQASLAQTEIDSQNSDEAAEDLPTESEPQQLENSAQLKGDIEEDGLEMSESQLMLQEDSKSLSGIGDIQSSMGLPDEVDAPQMTQLIESFQEEEIDELEEEVEEESQVVPGPELSRQASIAALEGRELRRAVSSAPVEKSNEDLTAEIVNSTRKKASLPPIEVDVDTPMVDLDQVAETIEKTQEASLPLLESQPMLMEEVPEIDVEPDRAPSPPPVLEEDIPAKPVSKSKSKQSSPVESGAMGAEPESPVLPVEPELPPVPIKTPVKSKKKSTGAKGKGKQKQVQPPPPVERAESESPLTSPPPMANDAASTSKPIASTSKVITPKAVTKASKKVTKGNGKRAKKLESPVESPDQLDLLHKSVIIDETIDGIEMNETNYEDLPLGRRNSNSSPRITSAAAKKRSVNFGADVSNKKRKTTANTKNKRKASEEPKETRKKAKKSSPVLRRTSEGRRTSYAESTASEASEQESEEDFEEEILHPREIVKPTTSKPRQSTGLSDTLPFTRIFGLWRTDGFYYPGTIVGRIGKDFKIKFDDNSKGNLKFNELRRCELLQGDIVRYRGDELDTETQVAAYSGDLKVLRVERGEAGDDVLPGVEMELDDVVVATYPTVADDQQKAVKNKFRIVLASACILPAAASQFDNRKITPQEMDQFDGVVTTPVKVAKVKAKAPSKINSQMFRGFAFLVTKVNFDDIYTGHRRGGGKKRSVTSAEISSYKATYAKLLKSHGAIIIELDDIFTVDQSDSNNLTPIFSNEFDGIHTILLLADRPSATPKYLIALALGIPCISREYVSNCIEIDELLDWKRFMVTAGYLQHLKAWAIGGQTRAITKTSFDLTSLEDVSEEDKIFGKSSFLFIQEKAGRKSPEVLSQQNVIRSILVAAGATRVDFVHTLTEAGTAEEFDYVSVDDKVRISSAMGLSQHEGVCSLEWIKQCLIQGLKLTTVSRLKEIAIPV